MSASFLLSVLFLLNTFRIDCKERFEYSSELMWTNALVLSDSRSFKSFSLIVLATLARGCSFGFLNTSGVAPLMPSFMNTVFSYSGTLSAILRIHDISSIGCTLG
ncbi:hypothetical protein MTO96_008628 [Rhipicephalus appendiculatus]